jgi:hypothetical protein
MMSGAVQAVRRIDSPVVAMAQARFSPNRRWATAYHEAGHAVIATLLGVPVRIATIEPRWGYDGLVRHDPVLSARNAELIADGRSRLRAERLILIALAGSEAQRRYRPSSVRRHHGQRDAEKALDLAMRVCGSERSVQAYLDWLSVVAADTVALRWPAIERVAQALYERGSLAKDEVLRLVRETALSALRSYGDAAGAADQVKMRGGARRPSSPPAAASPRS